ncbi:MAG: hypothetical protein Q9183_005785, partial [Haloplaca sp. 2 TL-2023]
MERLQSTTEKEATHPVSDPSRASRRVASIRSRILSYRTLGRKPLPIQTSPAKRATGYSDLPSELRIKILEYAFGVNLIWPYQGQTRNEILQQDRKMVVAARRQAFQNMVHRPSKRVFRRLRRSIEYSLTFMLFQDEGPWPYNISAKVGLHPLLVNQSMYDEGRKAFYANNVFHIPYGPLSIARKYFDNLRAENRNEIRKMVLDISPMDLTYEAFVSIEAQVRCTWQHRRDGEPPDDDADWWAGVTTQCLYSIWRAKLAWLRQWTQLAEIEIRFFSRVPEMLKMIPRHRFPWKDSFQLSGSELPRFLRGMVPLAVGPEPDYGTFSAYQYEDCDGTFGDQMMTLELLTRILLS